MILLGRSSDKERRPGFGISPLGMVFGAAGLIVGRLRASLYRRIGGPRFRLCRPEAAVPLIEQSPRIVLARKGGGPAGIGLYLAITNLGGFAAPTFLARSKGSLGTIHRDGRARSRAPVGFAPGGSARTRDGAASNRSARQCRGSRMSDDRVFAKCAWRLIPFMMLLYVVQLPRPRECRFRGAAR
jgi:hypothetical protein